MNKRETGFTLAEVLITLAVIGVVAALTIPSVVKNYQRQQLKVQLKKSYSTIMQVINNIQKDESWDIYGNYAPNKNTFPAVFAKYVNVLNTDTKCKIREDHKTLGGNEIPSSYGIYSDCINTKDGTSFMFWNQAYVDVNVYVLIIFADINGFKNRPNRLGYDTFGFQVCPNSTVKPLSGANIAPCYNGGVGRYCNFSEDSPYNGLGCTEKALKNEDYFKNLP